MCLSGSGHYGRVQPWEAIALGALQGVTELFPISSLGHSVVLPAVLGWQLDQHDPRFLAFLIATHLATAIVLFGFYARLWIGIVAGMLRSLRDREIGPHDAEAKLGWLIVVATVPAGLIGLLFQQRIQELLATPRIAAALLAVNGLGLLGIEVLRRRAMAPDPAWPVRFGWTRAVGVGVAQSFAFLPGISRTGATMGGALLAGLSHIDAARFAFLMATPIIAAAAVLKLPEVAVAGDPATLTAMGLGMAAAGGAAYLSVRFLDRYFRTDTLIPFGAYCVAAGGVSLLVLLTR
ncbi:MAG: undecaprenyl-diphosphate phosphatase [Chloroflexota bacterium]|nr:undecaprenyl-diphosphatase [Chloroflexota bacterium]MDE3102374.1 undecaprenyl-diphosphate phosphatase [Chloroflexota bacterium]